MIKLRRAQPEELPAMMEIIHQAQRSLAEQGVDQWQDGYPDEAAILRDIKQGYAYVAVEPDQPTGKDQILGMAALIPDGEPDYAVIYEGAWLGQGEYTYMTVHRVAVNEQARRKGIASFILSEAERLAREQGLAALRLDTHRDNRRMQACLERNGLIRCGIIHLGRENIGADKRETFQEKEEGEINPAYIRIAYEKLLGIF